MHDKPRVMALRQTTLFSLNETLIYHDSKV